jgi:hypothetical protein
MQHRLVNRQRQVDLSQQTDRQTGRQAGRHVDRAKESERLRFNNIVENRVRRTLDFG